MRFLFLEKRRCAVLRESKRSDVAKAGAMRLKAETVGAGHIQQRRAKPERLVSHRVAGGRDDLLFPQPKSEDGSR
jgi:hypothetical protein